MAYLLSLKAGILGFKKISKLSSYSSVCLKILYFHQANNLVTPILSNRKAKFSVN